MKLYGYEEVRENLLTMQEVSICANSEELMMISRFFLKASRRFSEASSRESHIHFKDFTNNQSLPVDIVIVKE
jgi:hypothetical protein